MGEEEGQLEEKLFTQAGTNQPPLWSAISATGLVISPGIVLEEQRNAARGASSVTGVVTLPRIVVRKNQGASSAIRMATLPRIVMNQTSAITVTREATSPVTALTAALRPVLSAEARVTSRWSAQVRRVPPLTPGQRRRRRRTRRTISRMLAQRIFEL